MRSAHEILRAHRPAEMTACEDIVAGLAARGVVVSRQAIENWLAARPRRGLSLYWFGQLAALFAVPAGEVEEGRAAIIAEMESAPERTRDLDPDPSAVVA